MKKKVSAIYFTYKRAILLDASLKSIFKNFKNLDKKINIIYNFNKEHDKSYRHLINTYSKKRLYKFIVNFHSLIYKYMLYNYFF